jgi:hypothetical protein
MRHLMTVQGTFHGRVLAARLGAEGVLVELRGLTDGPYPLQGAVEIFVDAPHYDEAREILLADAVDAAFDSDDQVSDDPVSDGPVSDHGALAGPGGSARRTATTGTEASPRSSHGRLRKTTVLIAVVVVLALLIVAGVTAVL